MRSFLEVTEMEFAVVHFVDTNSVDVVPCTWLYEDKAYWPPKKMAKTILPLRHKKVSPAEYWDLHKVIILGIFGTYDEAFKKLSTAQKRSDLESTDPEDLGRGKRKKTSINHESEDDNDEDMIPNTPQLTITNKFNDENRRPFISTVSSQNIIDTEETNFTLSTCSEKRCKSTNQGPMSPVDIGNLSSFDLGNISSFLSNIDVGNCSLDFGNSPSVPKQTNSNKTENFLKAILRNVISLKTKVNNIEQTLIDLSRKVQNSIEQNIGHPELNDSGLVDLKKMLPIKDLQDFSKVEEGLENELTQKLMISSLQKIGGDSGRQTVILMLKRMLTNAVGRNFSYQGQRGKQSFKETKVCKIIFEAVTTNPSMKNITDLELGRLISEWLRHAKARDERKKCKIVSQ